MAKTTFNLTRRGNAWIGRKMIKGKTYTKSVSHVTKQEANEILNDHYCDLEYSIRHGDAVKSTSRRSVKLGDIFDFYKYDPGGARLESKKDNIRAMTKIVSALRSGEVEKMPVDVLWDTDINGRNCIEAFMSAEAFKRGKSCHVSVNSTIRQAKSIFSKDMLRKYRRAYNIPADIHDFLDTPGFKTPRPGYRLPDADTIDKVWQLCEGFREANFNYYRIFLLASGAGLRRNEIKNARHDWIESYNGKYFIRVRQDGDFESKSGLDRIIPLHTSTAESLLESLRREGITNGYILTGDRERLLRRFVDVLRGAGLDVRLPLHELRKIYATRMNAHFGMAAAQRACGHANESTTNGYYVDAMVWGVDGVPIEIQGDPVVSRL